MRVRLKAAVRAYMAPLPAEETGNEPAVDAETVNLQLCPPNCRSPRLRGCSDTTLSDRGGVSPDELLAGQRRLSPHPRERESEALTPHAAGERHHPGLPSRDVPRPDPRECAAQTLGEIECIVVDDGSDDGTRGVAEEYARRDRRVRTLPSPMPGRAQPGTGGSRPRTGPLST